MWPIIVIVILVVITVYLFARRSNKEELPHVHYVCDQCGERDCVCRKEGPEAH
ncbi:MAG: hypothetical protein SWE60_15320 [Thermodesulfobacteriota bacterium]|nr:hypothetical protein [Thermodesulfobacteriota bacterium]